MIRRLRVLCVSLSLTVIAVHAAGRPAAADDEPTAESQSQNSEVPKPIEASAAVETIVVPAGFRVELVAAEPLVRDPIALEFDENGYAYVLEIPPYNEQAKPGPRSRSSIGRLEDTDGDGRFDRRTTFADGMKYPTGLFCYKGGLFVGDPPNLLYLRDTDGDGRADEREVLFTGFGAAPAGESQLNSFRWGLDNRVHISTGLDGGDIRPANQPDAPARTVRSRGILLDPRSRTFDLTSGGGQNGMSCDDWGRTFVCDNSNPIEMILYDDRYIERNPLMSAPGVVANLGPGTNFTKLARISPLEAWRVIRSQIRSEGAQFDEPHEAGRISGMFTSATGITIYRGDAWPEQFRGNVFVGEVANNLVYRAILKTEGLSTTSEAERGRVSFSTSDRDQRRDSLVEKETQPTLETEFLASTDTWFRPVQFSHGPDGNLYVLDMYRQLIEGIEWVPPEVLAKMDTTAGTERGRIYRIVPDAFHQPPPVRLGPMSTEALVEQLAHPNGWHRDTAARLLYERQDRQAIGPLRRLLSDSELPQGRLHALYALDGLKALKANDALRGLADRHPRVREHAVRLAEQFAESSDAVRHKLAGMIADADDGVRFQLAFSLGCLPPADRDPALIELLRRDGANSWFRVAIQSSLASGAAKMLAAVVADDQLRNAPHGQEFLITLADQIGRSKKSDEIGALVKAIDTLDGDDDATKTLAKNLIVALLGGGSGASADELLAHSQGCVKEVLMKMLSTARATALDQKESPDSRLEAITILGCGSFMSERPAFDELLAPQQPQPIQEAVLKLLGRFSDAAVVELLLAKWPSLTPGLRASAAEVLLSRPAWAESLLSAVEKKELSAGDFDPARVALLQSHPSPGIRERAATVFSGTAVAGRADVVSDYQQSLQLTGDADQGRAVFQKTCAACHELDGQGAAIGADLRSIRDQGPQAVLLNILDPNREINPKFLTYLVVTVEGRTITGMITEETPNNLTMRQPDGTPVPIPRLDIDEIQSTGLSYMPEGLESQINHQAMADLLAYLMSIGSGEQAGESGE